MNRPLRSPVDGGGVETGVLVNATLENLVCKYAHEPASLDTKLAFSVERLIKPLDYQVDEFIWGGVFSMNNLLEEHVWNAVRGVVAGEFQEALNFAVKGDAAIKLRFEITQKVVGHDLCHAMQPVMGDADESVVGRRR